MFRRLVLAFGVCVLTVPLAAARATGVRDYLYEWEPNGQEAGPQLILQEKLDLTGKFGVQCGKVWLFTYFGGGEHPPFTLDRSTGAISGTYSFPTNTVGAGSSYRASEGDYYAVKSAGPMVMTLNAQATTAVAIGTLELKLYGYTKAHGHGAHRVKRRRFLRASCSIAFNAPNRYAEVAAPLGESGPAPNTVT